MNRSLSTIIVIITIFLQGTLYAQDYFLKSNGPYDPSIPTPEQFLGYEIGSQHTRHDMIVSYLQKLAEVSNKATITEYGRTYEKRKLIILTITDPKHHQNIEQIKQKHRSICDPSNTQTQTNDLPVFINLGYNVHGNEPSSSEAAMLTAYTLVAGTSDKIQNYLNDAIIFIDPTINPDGRDRHTQWANTYQGSPLVSDPMDAEHNEGWPRGRTNHYWFDLNRDWLLGIHPESRGKLDWYHEWYPNVVTDFHEMGTNSSYFFEPMKANGSKDPIMPKENYTSLNEKFAEYFSSDLDAIGSLYFTKEVFDGTYPGYGSSYPDLQGGLGLLFEQASSRGHVQETTMGKITFPFTIRNQYISSLATVRGAVENKEMLYKYQQEFFQSAIDKAGRSAVKGYVFGDQFDKNRTMAFIDKLLLHKIKVYKLKSRVSRNGKSFDPGTSYIIPTKQAQYRMVQTMFETYKNYTDSVFYDASAWSLANFYNMPYASVNSISSLGGEVNSISELTDQYSVDKSSYAYLIAWDDYNAPAALNYLKLNGVQLSSGFKPFEINIDNQRKSFGYGALLIPIQKQTISSDSLYNLLNAIVKNYNLPVHSVSSGYSSNGVDLGSGSFNAIKPLKAAMFIGDGVSSYEAGEVWHLLDQRVGAPISKLQLRMFPRVNLDKYSTIVMVSGSYQQLDSVGVNRIRDWVSKGNTLITIRQASKWAIEKKLVKEELIKKKDDAENSKKGKTVQRLAYADAREYRGKEQVGGAIFTVNLDTTHPLAFGYRSPTIPVYRNSTVWIKPSKNPYSTVAKYTSRPHVDGFISKKNLDDYLKPSASLIVSKIGQGRVVMFADNPNFRGSWYGTNRLFLNAMFLGNHIAIPKAD